MTIQRISDASYLFQYHDKKVIFNVSDKIGNADFRYLLALKAGESFEKNLQKHKGIPLAIQEFEIGMTSWICEQESKTTSLQRIASSISSFIHQHGDDGILRFRITPSPASKNTPQLIQKEIKSALLQKQLARTSLGALHGSQVITPDEFEKGIRGKDSLNEMYQIDQKRFEDPYTRLATAAFQELEQDFISKDYFKPEDCQYSLIKDRDDLLLVHRDNQTYLNTDRNKITIDAYKTFLIKEYGKEKIDYIQHRYGFSFEKMERLTPEHIYRINIGLNALEVQDLNELLPKLRRLKDLLDAQPDQLDKPLQAIYEQKNHNFADLTGQEIRGIYRMAHTGGNQGALSDVAHWLNNLGPLPEKVDQLSIDAFSTLLKILRATPEERESALTGRKINNTFIQSGYTNAELAEYKDWVDDHQLLEISPHLENSRDPLAYHELLAQVVAKIHLVKEHPTEALRVGALIPAPRDKNGEERWYKVGSCCSNGHGIFTYTLESACKGLNLPPIILYRSTASSFYFMHRSGSILSDLNTFKAPGSEGIDRSDHYQNKFFADRTIRYGSVIYMRQTNTWNPI